MLYKQVLLDYLHTYTIFNLKESKIKSYHYHYLKTDKLRYFHGSLAPNIILYVSGKRWEFASNS